MTGGRLDETDLDALLSEILAGAEGDDAQFRAFRQAFAHSVGLPADAFVIGEPVTVVAIDYAGNTRRGLTARCLRADGSEHVIALADVSFREGTERCPSRGGLPHVAGARSHTCSPTPAAPGPEAPG